MFFSKSLRRPFKNILLFKKLTQFKYHQTEVSNQGSKLNPCNFSNLSIMQLANEEHEKAMETVYESLLAMGIKKQNIREISSRQHGYAMLNPCLTNYVRDCHFCKYRTTCPNEKKVANDERFKPDLIISIGGDGTFLRASHLIHERLQTGSVPILGINSNPSFSEGRLCGTTNGLTIGDMVKLTIQNNKDTVRQIKRSRIKIKLTSRNEVDLWNINDFHHSGETVETPGIRSSKIKTSIDDPEDYFTTELPILALNDVYIGERYASMVTDLEIWYQDIRKLDEEDTQHRKQKHSGLIVCTGTGSTGWTKSANHISPEILNTVINYLKSTGKLSDNVVNETEILTAATDKINSQRTVFSPDKHYLGLTFREPISSKISMANDSNILKVKKVTAKSKLKYGMLSIDGTTYYDFGRGSIVECETDPRHALNCLNVGQTN